MSISIKEMKLHKNFSVHPESTSASCMATLQDTECEMKERSVNGADYSLVQSCAGVNIELLWRIGILNLFLVFIVFTSNLKGCKHRVKKPKHLNIQTAQQISK